MLFGGEKEKKKNLKYGKFVDKGLKNEFYPGEPELTDGSSNFGPGPWYQDQEPVLAPPPVTLIP